MLFLELTLHILHPYTILLFSLYFLSPENPWLKGSLLFNIQKELPFPSTSRHFVHTGSTLGPMQKTTFFGGSRVPIMPCAHGNMMDRPLSVSSSTLNHLSNLLIKKQPETTGPYFTREKGQNVESTVTTLLTSKLQATVTAFSISLYQEKTLAM